MRASCYKQKGKYFEAGVRKIIKDICPDCRNSTWSTKIEDLGQGNVKIYTCKKCGYESVEVASESGIINLADPRKYKFGSIGWQDAMINNIKEKRRHGEALGAAEIGFLEVQGQHNKRIESGIKSKYKTIGDKQRKYLFVVYAGKPHKLSTNSFFHFLTVSKSATIKQFHKEYKGYKIYSVDKERKIQTIRG
jgi:Zn ribbon nucleic-acid-binding protein